MGTHDSAIHDGRTVKFQVNRDVFSEAVSFAVKLLPQRTTLPILSGILIQANADGLVLSSFDYEVSSQTEIQADVEEPGTVLVSGRLLAEIAGRLPNAPVRVSTEDARISVNCGSSNFTLLSMPVVLEADRLQVGATDGSHVGSPARAVVGIRLMEEPSARWGDACGIGQEPGDAEFAFDFLKLRCDLATEGALEALA